MVVLFRFRKKFQFLFLLLKKKIVFCGRLGGISNWLAQLCLRGISSGLHSHELIPGKAWTWRSCSFAFRCQPSWLPFIPKLAATVRICMCEAGHLWPSFPTKSYFGSVLTSLCSSQWTWRLCQETLCFPGGSFPGSRASSRGPQLSASTRVIWKVAQMWK